MFEFVLQRIDIIELYSNKLF